VLITLLMVTDIAIWLTLDLPISMRNSRHYSYILNFLILIIIIKVFEVNAVPLSMIIHRGLSKMTLCCINLLITSDMPVDFIGYSQTNFVNASITIKT